jgi:hypothetical protein
MLYMNQNIVNLVWTLAYDDDDDYDILWMGRLSLQSLEIRDSVIDLRSVQSIIQMGRLIHLFRELSLRWCTFHLDVFEVFIRSLSDQQTHPMFDTVRLDHATVITDDEYGLLIPTSFGNLHVQHGSLLGTTFNPDKLVQSMTDLANHNTCTQSWFIAWRWSTQLSDSLWRRPSIQSRSIGTHHWFGRGLSSDCCHVCGALQQNTSVKSLTIR